MLTLEVIVEMVTSDILSIPASKSLQDFWHFYVSNLVYDIPYRNTLDWFFTRPSGENFWKFESYAYIV